MQHLNINVKFEGLEPFDYLEYNLEWAKKPIYQEMLRRFVKTFYSQDMKDWKIEDFDQSDENYQRMIDAAIKSNNLLGVEILWQGIYIYDEVFPDFQFDLFTAVEFGNLKTFQHILYAKMNYFTFDEYPDIDYSDLLISKDPEIQRFLQKIKGFVDSGGQLELMSKYAAEGRLDVEEGFPGISEYIEKCEAFYQAVENF